MNFTIIIRTTRLQEQTGKSLIPATNHWFEFKATNDRLSSELEEVGQQAANLEVYEEKRKEVEAKVGGLLEQLEALG